MGKLSRRDMEELREACSYDCGYTDTEEVVKDITAQVLEELDSDTTYGDEVGLVDSDRGEEMCIRDRGRTDGVHQNSFTENGRRTV